MLNYKFVIKLLISSFVLYLIFSKIEISEFFLNIKKIGFAAISVLLILGLLKFVVETMRWQFVLKTIGFKFKFKYLLSLYLIGGFFSNFLPSTIGGDLARTAFIKGQNLKVSTVVNTILFERFTGLYSVFIMCLLAVAVGWDQISEYLRIFVLVYAVIGIFVMSLIYIFFNKITVLFSILENKYSFKILKRIGSILKILDFSNYKKKTIISTMLFSIVMQFVVISVTALVGVSMGLEQVEMLTYFIIMPPVWIITMLPISINGLGIREGVFALFLSNLGVSVEQSTALSLLSFLPFVSISLVGGIIFILGSFSMDKIKITSWEND